MAESLAYLDHAAVAPISGPTADAIRQWVDQASSRGATVWTQWDRGIDQTRAAAARLIGASEKEIALVGNTTAGVSLVAEGLAWREGDNVVTLADEFPSNLYPWLNLASRGVETRRVPTDLGRLDLDRLDDACDERTRLISVSWVGYSTGYRQDLTAIAEIAHRSGISCLSMRFRDWARFHWMSLRRRSTFWRPTVTSGCSARKAPAFFISAANT